MGLRETGQLCHRGVLDFEGPKFRYVFLQLVPYFKQAALNALGKASKEMVPRILREFRDIVAMNEEELRRNTVFVR